MAGLCLFAGGMLAAKLAGVAVFTLAWTHSVEKIAWEEDWRGLPDGLGLLEGGGQGSGAGMDPAPDATFSGGVWRWKPAVPPLAEVVLRRSGAIADWRLCTSGSCRSMGELVDMKADPVILRPCADLSP